MTDHNIQGVIAAVPTFIDDEAKLNLDAFLNHCKWAFDNGCNALNILGTTGEANSLNVDARKTIMQAAANAFDTSKLMVGTGVCDLETTLELTCYADQLGYPVALILPPFYYNPLSDDTIFNYFKQLDAKLGSAKIKLYLYNFPALTNVKFSVELIKLLADAFPNRIVGIKDSSGDIEYCKQIVAGTKNFKIFPSNEVNIADAKQNGFAGCISGSVNVSCPQVAKIWQNANCENSANLMQEINFLRTQISTQPLIQAVKYLISVRENDDDLALMMPPLLSLSKNQKQQLSNVVDQLNYNK